MAAVMSRSHQQHSSPESAGRAEGYYTPTYVFLVVGLTIFLIGVAVCRQPVTSYTARAILQVTGGDEAEPAHDAATRQSKIAAELTSDAALADAAAGLGEGAQDELAARLRETVQVDVRPGPKEGEVRVALWNTGGSKQQTLAVVRHLADRFVEAHPGRKVSHQDGSRCEKAEQAVQKAKQEVEQAEAELNAFLKRHADSFSPDGAPLQPAGGHLGDEDNGTGEDSQSAANETASMRTSVNGVHVRTADGAEASPAASAERRPKNPAWLELAERLDVLRAAHRQLLKSKTPEHPQVRALQWQLEQLEAELAQVPETIPGDDVEEAKTSVEPDRAGSNAIADSGNGKPPAGTAAIRPAQLMDTFRKLNAVCDAARRRHEEALAARRAALQQRRSLSQDAVVLVEPAQIVVRHGGGPNKRGLAIFGSLALIVAGAAGWQSRLVERPAALISAGQVEHLGVPVVAALSTQDGPALPQPAITNPRWISWLTFVCEAAMVGTALWVLFAVFSDWSLAAHAVWDPLSAFGEAIWSRWP